LKHFIAMLSLLLVFVLAGCSSESLADLGLEDMTGKDILTQLATGELVPDGYHVSVYDHELVVITEHNEFSVPMPEDEFYLSVAPYTTLTHGCTFHSATGCRGELEQETFQVRFELEDGTVVIDQEMTSLANGFIDLWLPRDVEGTLTITQGDLSSSKVISTAPGSPTCETTMQLT